MPPSKPAPLTSLVTTDYAGITRGRAIPAARFQPRGTTTAGWVPANMSLTPFDLIADPNPWGSRGDLRLLADPGARFRVASEGFTTPLDLVMSDIVEFDGSPWMCCPRHFLKVALADFHSETGLELIAAFEHEFQILGSPLPPAPAFSLQALRRADPLGPIVMAALAAAGLEPETFVAEYGRDQYEVTVAPAPGLAAADRAVALREIIRELIRNRGWRVSFAPKTAVAGVGNGVHIHLSFRDSKGHNRTFDAKRSAGLSALAGAFAAGVIRHLPALTAFTAPSPISALRLTPHHWSSSYTWFGTQDREASLRVCPAHSIGGADPARAFNLEYRPADATACPHLALAVVVRAGLEGIRRKLAVPPLFSGDPALLAEAERSKLGLHRLPGSLSAALDVLVADPIVTSWFAPLALDTYLGMKRKELEIAGIQPDDSMCARYAEIY